MGSRLAILAGAVALAAIGGTASADNKKLARDLFELGIEEYKTKQYAAAAQSMSKSYALDPQPNALYALAQAERLADNCKDALVHYAKVLEESKDPKIKSAVEANIELCTQIESGQAPQEEPKDKAEQDRLDAPVLQIRTVVRTEQKTDKLTIVLYAVGSTAFGGGVVTYFLARSARSDADRAASLDEYNDLYDRSQNMKLIAYGAAGLGIGLATWATIRVLGGKKTTTETRAPEIAISPIQGGSLVSWSGRW